MHLKPQFNKKNTSQFQLMFSNSGSLKVKRLEYLYCTHHCFPKFSSHSPQIQKKMSGQALVQICARALFYPPVLTTLTKNMYTLVSHAAILITLCMV